MKGFEPSLLEKLFDDAPHEVAFGVIKRLSIEEFKDSVARDVEGLLNNRFVVDEELLKKFPHCQRSLATYGIHDFSGRSLASSTDRTFICHSLEVAVARHEPRLTEVKIVLDKAQNSTGALRFSINALLVIHPSREPVNFDVLLQPTTLQYSVSRNRRVAAA
ncbi:MAG: type VI secretion system baseplate subunit TssE [Rhodanobacter sp.]